MGRVWRGLYRWLEGAQIVFPWTKSHDQLTLSLGVGTSNRHGASGFFVIQNKPLFLQTTWF